MPGIYLRLMNYRSTSKLCRKEICAKHRLYLCLRKMDGGTLPSSHSIIRRLRFFLRLRCSSFFLSRRTSKSLEYPVSPLLSQDRIRHGPAYVHKIHKRIQLRLYAVQRSLQIRLLLRRCIASKNYTPMATTFLSSLQSAHARCGFSKCRASAVANLVYQPPHSRENRP